MTQKDFQLEKVLADAVASQFVPREQYDAALETIEKLRGIIARPDSQFAIMDTMKNKDLVFLGDVRIFVMPNATVKNNNFVRSNSNWKDVVYDGFGMVIH